MRTEQTAPLLWALLLGAGLIPPATPAEQGYEYGKALLAFRSTSLPTEDLVERLISRLERQPETLGDVLLLRAAMLRAQTRSASRERQQQLLEQASSLYREFLTKFPRHRLAEQAGDDESSLSDALVRVLMENARDVAGTNANEATRLRNAAAAILARSAATHKAAAQAHYPRFVLACRNLRIWIAEHQHIDPPPPPPPVLVKAFEESFELWVPEDQRCVAIASNEILNSDPKDPERRKRATELATLCAARAEGTNENDRTPENEATACYPLISAFYYSIEGRVWSAIPEVEKAEAAWRELLLLELTNPTPEQTRRLNTIKFASLYDCMRMRMDTGKFADAALLVEEIQTTPGLRGFFASDPGKQTQLLYAQAQISPPEADATNFEKAFKRLNAALADEPPGSKWRNDFCRAMGELLISADTRRIRLLLPPATWSGAGHGLFLEAVERHRVSRENATSDPVRAQAVFEEAASKYETAIRCFRDALRTLRRPETPLSERLALEGQCWLEQGTCYLSLKQYAEAAAAGDGLIAAFLPDLRAKWMPAAASFPGKAYPQALVQSLATIDKPEDGWLAKALRLEQTAMDENVRSAPTTWNKRIQLETATKRAALVERYLPGQGRNDRDYMAAAVDLEEARAQAEAAKAMTDDTAKAQKYRQALQRYLSSAEKFQKVPAASPSWLKAVYQSGSCYAMAHELWATRKLRCEATERAAQLAQWGQKATERFQAYEDALRQNPTTDAAELHRRTSSLGLILVARTAICREAGQWDQVLATADAHAKWMAESGSRTGQDAVLLNTFHALIGLAAGNPAPQCDPYLARADRTLKELRQLKPDDHALYAFLANALAQRYLAAARQAAAPGVHVRQAFQPDDGRSPGASSQTTALSRERPTGAAADRAGPCDRRAAELLSLRVEAMEKDPAYVPKLDDYTGVLSRFYQARMAREAVDWATGRLFKKFDPKGKCAAIPSDDEDQWKTIRLRMLELIRYDDLRKWENCKQDHVALLDWMYDTAEGTALKEGSPNRPEFDKQNENLDKAAAALSTIEKNYPDCATMDPAKGLGGRSFLGVIKDELDLRRKLRAARDLISALALNVASDLEKDPAQQEAVKKYREVALEQITILIEILGVTPQMLIRQADLERATGKLDKALATLEDVLKRVDDSNSPIYVGARKRISEIYALQKEWRSAVEYPEFILLGAGLEDRLVREEWPDIGAFLKNCYANGAPRSAEVKKILEDAEKK